MEDPDAGLAALRDVLEPDGAMHLMVYAPYGRVGIYMLREFCRRIGVRATDEDIGQLHCRGPGVASPASAGKCNARGPGILARGSASRCALAPAGPGVFRASISGFHQDRAINIRQVDQTGALFTLLWRNGANSSQTAQIAQLSWRSSMRR